MRISCFRNTSQLSLLKRWVNTLLPHRTSSSSYSFGIAESQLTHLRGIFSLRDSLLKSADFESKMEVVKVALKLESAALEKVAVTAGDKSFTYAEVLRSAFNISSILENKDGSNGHVAEGEESAEKQVVEAEAGKKADGPRIGIMAKPCAEFVAAMWAAWLNGAVAVPLALSYPEAELMHVMTDADISVVVATEEYREILEKVVEKSPGAKLYILPPVVNTHGNEITDTQSLDKLLVEVKNRSLTLSGEEAALIIYTSGTTGRPKGVVHTQAGLGAQVRMLSEAWGYTADDRFLHCLPLHHVHGLINSLLAPLYAGATIDLLPKFSTSGVWQRWRSSYPVSGEVAATPITVFTGVPTIYVRLLQGYETMDAETQKASADAARQLRLMMCGSSALPQPVMDQWESLTGHRLLERYGMTEFGMGLTNPLHGERRPGFVGKPFPGIEIRVDDSDSDVKGVGELLMKSPSMFREYWRQPKVTADNFTEDGYFRTGDTVTIEDGYVKILGRTSVDIIKVGGFKLSALEIEAVLLEHPAIAECAVLGLPDKDYGELMCVVIVPPEAKAAEAAATSEPVLTLKELHKWGADKMAPYKLPQKLLIWESMPRNAMGKVNKKELKKTLLESTS
ncbi:malonyl-CoA/methylmalonyl-CoA synthetase [Marchantia polymorpha subsp. ruderalis]|uniref:Uncharacterized protein n=2 Tax=Marchantia polymorpha TaxID=3197 RepID=A0AAF6AMQ8_MARPO|nr:hypothetical protein MARPO_0036s0029 [Marchantia polymorpha]PTQ41031.1 hypothetical protein MARPO_0036s0029 [Marchantia polymorpha]BBM97727.1 hypothetical protein Mp_1g07850 [Marchantia polymorpha subsp. ruderalis]BBM97728.1 hypothetical protein Mp_1g07850 [Marchantia polymorpha subsp. ruderalis]|eukprot:PTQ41030.1 hypothetical protein MARPO_0036s0029 [Marchantia polymorpha]